MNFITGWSIFFAVIFILFGIITFSVTCYIICDNDELNPELRRITNNIRRACIGGFLISFIIAITSYNYKLPKIKEENRHIEQTRMVELNYTEYKQKAEGYDNMKKALENEIFVHGQHVKLLNKELEEKELEILKLKEQLNVED